jgi:hypothetical protein
VEWGHPDGGPSFCGPAADLRDPANDPHDPDKDSADPAGDLPDAAGDVGDPDTNASNGVRDLHPPCHSSTLVQIDWLALDSLSAQRSVLGMSSVGSAINLNGN